jgi:hypothetical protein
MSRGSTLSKGLTMATPPVQPQSRRILSNLIAKLKLPDSPYTRFSKILNETKQLEELMYRCVRMDILALIDEGRLKSIKGSVNFL